MARPALLDTLNEALGRRLTTVVAGPGGGKTTLLASWAGKVPCAWYTLGPEDTALPVLVRGLVDALRVRLPGLLELIAGCVGAPAGGEFDELGRADAVAAALTDALERECAADLALVIDDVQWLGAEGPSVRLLESLCRQAPPRLHLVLSSRTRPPFPVERLRGRGELLELDGAMLALSSGETEDLLAGVLGDGESGSLARQVHGLTGGWPAATHLTAHWLRRCKPGERVTALAMLHRPVGPLFGYLVEEVFETNDVSLHALLRRVAPLARFTVELCWALGVDIDEAELARLARGGLFVRQHPGQQDWFTLGPLVRDFALRWVHPQARQRVLRCAMSWFTDNGHPLDALRCAVALDSPDQIVRFLVDHGQALLAQGNGAELLAAASGLPARLRVDTIEQLEAQARLVRGDWRGALTCLRRAGGDGSGLTPALAWRLCWIHYARGGLDEAVAVFDRSRLGDETTSDEALSLSWAASARWRRGELTQCRSLAHRAMAAATAAMDDAALAAAHHALLLVCSAERDRAGAQTHATAGLAAARRANDVVRTVLIRIHRAGEQVDQGSYTEAVQELDDAVEQAERIGYVPGVAHGRYHRGVAQLRLGRLDEAIADFEASKTACQCIDSRDVALPLLGLAGVYQERGDVALSRAAYTEAVSMAERLGDRRVLVLGLAGLAGVLAGEDPVRAGRLAERAVEGSGHGSDRVIALLAAGWVALTRGAPERAVRLAIDAAEAAGAGWNRAGLAEALELRAAASSDAAGAFATGALPRLQEAARIWADIGSRIASARNAVAQLRLAGAAECDLVAAEQGLRALGVQAVPAVGLLSAISVPVRAVQVRTLGGFRILRDGRPVRATEWNSKKARDLLKRLISRRGRPTPREVLIEALWPGEDSARCANRLSVALSTVRTMLDPERRYEPDHFVRADKHVVALANLRVDVEEFLAAAARVAGRSPELQVLHELRMAEALYTGDFLEEDPYEDWAVPLREQAKAAYLAVAMKLADAARHLGDEDLAVLCYLRVLERDPYDEEAHLRLTTVLGASGHHGQAQASYRCYTQRMAELGIAPAPFPDPRHRPQQPTCARS
ncbi:MAG: BTAD domain-containing putative transcriptional regulator [Pseudonocardiaceae bacterium]